MFGLAWRLEMGRNEGSRGLYDRRFGGGDIQSSQVRGILNLCSAIRRNTSSEDDGVQ